jgi:hypothetical protein
MSISKHEKIEKLSNLIENICTELNTAASLVTKFDDMGVDSIYANRGSIKNMTGKEDHYAVDNLIKSNNSIEYKDEHITIVNLDGSVDNLSNFSRNCIEADKLETATFEKFECEKPECENISSQHNNCKVEKHINYDLFMSIRAKCLKNVPIEDYNKNEVLQIVIYNNIWATVKPNSANSTDTLLSSSVIFFGTIDETSLVKVPKFFIKAELNLKYNNTNFIRDKLFVDINNFDKQKFYGLEYNELLVILHHIGAYNDCPITTDVSNSHVIFNIRFYDSNTCDANENSMYLMFELEKKCIGEFSKVVFSQRDYELKTMLMDYTVSKMDKLVCSKLFQESEWLIIQPILFQIWNNIIKDLKTTSDKK